ncbi:P-loop containing nucleoside triphosphate hydrolase protein [Radiomyces spectabilis]|uniref:P-loop containing nucleoside triphosphate hydrolase protein n=1 Tax=Radiomyces spectabilis TaxID=64574 RepID=UPI00221EB7D9|nr:P-loop containing nucleoside triphosphate hydrolase protein [Radiomyces spectabilis]KAI8371678.1 P-loop containing nucleoside triphosphate hydrolase protein [Radiomyces spectabilis]
MDLFHLLGSGASFDKKRFKGDIELFDARQAAAEKKNAAATDPQLRSQLLDELDFFKTTHTVVGETKKSKRTDADSATTEEPASKKPKSSTIVTINTLEEAKQFRKEQKIRVYGSDIPLPFTSFEDLATGSYGLDSLLYKNLKNNKYDQPTPIQMQSIPIMLKGRDLMSCAPTGSGKTLAYLLPIVEDLKKPEKAGYRALIIAPTRELAHQIDRELQKLAVGTKLRTNVLTKTTAADKAQDPQSRKKFDILITTPLRLVYAIKEDKVDLSHVRHLVLDEADKLLDGGFLEQTDEIFAACSAPTVRKSLFSATFSSTVEELAKSVMKDPIRVVIGSKNAATDTIDQKLLFTGTEAGKKVALRQYIQGGIKPPVLIFVESIERAKQLFHELVYDGINVEVIHSERTKAQRDRIIDQFRLGKIWVLIATDLMARGLDFKAVNLVINYDFPQSVASYIHRIGRTGRAGRTGEAVTYYSKEDLPYLRKIVNVMKESGCEVPDWMLTLKKEKLKRPKKQTNKKDDKNKSKDGKTDKKPSGKKPKLSEDNETASA